MTVRNEEMQALIDAHAELAQECLDTWQEAESDYDTTETPDSIKHYFSQREWPLETVFRNHELWIRTDGREGTQANFQGCDLSELAGWTCNRDHSLDEIGTYISDRTSFHDRNLQGAIFAGADLTFIGFCDARLDGADFAGATLHCTDMTGANLTDVNFSGALISGTLRHPFERCILQGADFRHANYEQLDLESADTIGVLLADPDPDNEEEEERRGLFFGYSFSDYPPAKVSQSLFTHLIQFMPLEDFGRVTIV